MHLSWRCSCSRRRVGGLSQRGGCLRLAGCRRRRAHRRRVGLAVGGGAVPAAAAPAARAVGLRVGCHVACRGRGQVAGSSSQIAGPAQPGTACSAQPSAAAAAVPVSSPTADQPAWHAARRGQPRTCAAATRFEPPKQRRIPSTLGADAAPTLGLGVQGAARHLCHQDLAALAGARLHKIQRALQMVWRKERRTLNQERSQGKARGSRRWQAGGLHKEQRALQWCEGGACACEAGDGQAGGFKEHVALPCPPSQTPPHLINPQQQLPQPTSSSSSTVNSPATVGGVSGSASLQRAAAPGRQAERGARSALGPVLHPHLWGPFCYKHAVPTPFLTLPSDPPSSTPRPPRLTQHVGAGGGVDARHRLRHAVAVEVAPAELQQVAAACAHAVVRHCSAAGRRGFGAREMRGRVGWGAAASRAS